MTIDLQLTTIDVDSTSLNFSGEAYVAMLANLQGNIVKPHGRDFSSHLFLAFNVADIAAVKRWIVARVLPLLTSAGAQAQQSARFRATGAGGGLFGGFALSADGYTALGLTLPDDASFMRGMKHPDTTPGLGLNDPPVHSWQAGFQATLHAMVMLADDEQATVDAAVEALTASMAGVATLVVNEPGAVFRNARGNVIEHFGFADGVSQPLFMATDIEKARRNGGLENYDPSAPLCNVLLKDPNGGALAFGSYLVFRKLGQDVAAFRAQEAALAKALALGPDQPELAGAYIVGRFRDGTPLSAQPVDGWTNEPNNFNYDHDSEAMRCPFHSHTRKTNPRGDKEREFGLAEGEDRSRRLARRAVSFGPLELAPPPGADVGLLFMCVQSSIVNQFEFMQAIWANFTDFLRPGTGLDGVIGQGAPGSPAVPQSFPNTWGVRRAGTTAFTFKPCVDLRGGEYFFLPSLDSLARLQVN
ncbi:MAG: peroxidase [Pseudomonadota bacterium]